MKRWTRTAVILGVAAGLTGPAPSRAMELGLTVTTPWPAAEGGMTSVRLKMGVDPDATDVVDPRFDVAALPSRVLTATIRRPGFAPLWWDVRGEQGYPQIWDVEVSAPSGAPVTLAWTPPAVANGCAALAWTIADTTVPDRPRSIAVEASSYTFQNSGTLARRFTFSADRAPVGPPPLPPINLWSPRQGRSSVYLAWSGGGHVDRRYHVYREGAGGPIRLTANPQRATSYVDTAADTASSLAYWVTAVDGQGCESLRSTRAVVTPRR